MGHYVPTRTSNTVLPRSQKHRGCGKTRCFRVLKVLREFALFEPCLCTSITQARHKLSQVHKKTPLVRLWVFLHQNAKALTVMT